MTFFGSFAPTTNPYPPVSATRRARKPNPFSQQVKTSAATDSRHDALTPFDAVADTFLADLGRHESVVSDGEAESTSASIKSADATTVGPSDEALLHAAMRHEGAPVIDATKVPLACDNVVAERMAKEIEKAAKGGKPAREDEEKAGEDTPAVNAERAWDGKSVGDVVRTMAKDPQKHALLKQVGSLLHDKMAFPLETQLPVIQRIIRETSESLNVPYGAAAFTLMMLIGCIVGRAYELEMKADWHVPGNLWGCLIAPSGMRKTATYRIIFDELVRINKKELAEWHKKDEEYHKNSRVYAKAAAKAAKLNEELSVAKPERPKRIQHLCDDISLYALAEALQDNPRGIARVIDELVGLLNSLAHDVKTREKHLRAYSCDQLSYSRRQVHIYAENACLSIFGGIQPSVLARLAVAFENDGLLDRFLFVNIDRTGPNVWTDKCVSAEVVDTVKKLTHRLVELPMEETDDGKQVPNVVRMAPEAHALYTEWYNNLALEGWTSCYPGRYDKFEEQAAKLALNLHIAEAVLLGTSPLAPVSVETMERALAYADWLKAHQLAAMELMRPVQRFNGWTVRQAVLCSLAEAEDKIKCDGGKVSFKTLFAMVTKKIYGYDDSRELRKVVKELKLPGAVNCPQPDGKRGRGYYIRDDVMEQAKTVLKQREAEMKAASSPDGEAA
jgi:hypothetical protein